jgi:hypothetical protein
MNRNHILAAGAASLLLLAACGSDDEGSDAQSTEPAAVTSAAATDAPAETAPAATEAPVETTEASGGTDLEAACQAWFEADTAVTEYLSTGQGDADAVLATLDAAIAAAPPDNVQRLTDLKAAAEPQIQNPESDVSDETLTLYSDTIGWVSDNCDVDVIDVTAKEYEYSGIPDTISTGYHVVNFSNEGNEQHEMFAFRINDGVTESLDEIFALPEEEIFTKITPVNGSYAPPGQSEASAWSLTEAGKYAVVCFISVGSVGDTEGEGPPHFTQGMVKEFEVTS